MSVGTKSKPAWCRVHWNSTRRVWSVRHGEGPIEWASSFLLIECTLVVRPSGVARYRRLRQKTVHAYVKGVRQPLLVDPRGLVWVRLRYSPKVGHFFVEGNEGRAITEALAVRFDEDGSAWAVLSVG